MKRLWQSIVLAVAFHGPLALASGQVIFSGEKPLAAANGAPFFGFVRDPAGRAIPKAMVTLESAQAKTRVVLQSDRLGHFYFAGFRPDIDPKQVEVTCAKPGYRPLKKTFRPPRGKPTAEAPVEVLCVLEDAAGE
ncbi:MAG: carboxypeptidase regulatory-like domain-containing protein [Gammaproteobacteria bacterium]|nr:carboxypeptidase regulatory-like domain-containing protein [Gammaproteobacteria bacterium]